MKRLLEQKKNRYDLSIGYNIHSYSPLLSLSLQAIVVDFKAYLRREEVIKSIEVVYQCEIKISRFGQPLVESTESDRQGIERR